MHSRKVALMLWCLLLPIAARGQNLNEELFAAARKGDVAAVKALLDKGVDVNAKTNYGATALSYACDKGHAEVVKLLLERGADPNAKDTFYGEVPMGWALSRDHYDIVKLLLDHGAQGKERALIAGADGGNVELVKAILDKGDLKPETLKSYAGTYKSDQVGEMVIAIKDGKLTGSIPGQPLLTLGATSKNTFSILEFDGITITFNLETDKVVSLTLKTGGGAFEMKKAEQKQ